MEEERNEAGRRDAAGGVRALEQLGGGEGGARGAMLRAVIDAAEAELRSRSTRRPHGQDPTLARAKYHRAMEVQRRCREA